MMSGTLKELCKTINASPSISSNSSSNLTLPLPANLVEVIHAYLDKHTSPDESESQRLQDELLNIYQASVLDKPSRLGPFLAILRPLKPALSGSGRLLQWWDKLSIPVLSNLGEHKGLAVESRLTLLDTLVYDEDEDVGHIEDAKMTSQVLAERLVTIYLGKSKTADELFDIQARYGAGQIHFILLAYGKKRPRDFLTLINKFYVEKSSRIQILALLCEFVRHEPPHLHQVLETPLFDNVLRCLQSDTSTRVISLTITALIMILPHIPSSASKYLPALFNIYSRLLFWDRERKRDESQKFVSDDDSREVSVSVTDKENSWDKLSYLLESNDETVPELMSYFTFLYGLYPINFMSYIRKPQRYLRHANFPGADDLDVEPREIRQRSEPFRQLHSLHPNFFLMTIESELTDNNRWMKSEAADVVAECMSLYSPLRNDTAQARRSVSVLEPNTDVPEHSLLDSDSTTPFQLRHNSWRNTQYPAVALLSDDPEAQRRLSQISHSVFDSPSIRPSDRLDSPTIPPQMLTSPSHNHLNELHAQKSSRGSIYQSLTNESVTSLALSNNHDIASSIHVDAYLASLTSREAFPRSRSPSLRTPNVTADANLKVAYLHREIQLLRNDLNFERYLKQQHLSAIGQLRSKQIKDARVEAEIQNLITSNSNLRSKLEDAKSLNVQMKKETEKSKSYSRKWESDLSVKLKILREEQKKWIVERDELKRDLQLAKERTEKLKQIVVTSESKELASRQKVQSVESSLDELERLRAEVDKLTLSLQTYEAGEIEAVRAKENEEEALRYVSLMRMELDAHDDELINTKLAFQEEIRGLQEAAADHHGRQKFESISQEMIDEALEVNRRRNFELQKAHDHLRNQFSELSLKYRDLKERTEHNSHGTDNELHSALLGGPAYSGSPNQIPTREPGSCSGHSIQADIFESPNMFPIRSGGIPSPTTPGGRNVGFGGHQTQTFQQPNPFNPPVSGPSHGSKSTTTDSDGQSQDTQGNTKAKVKAQSENRIYGRGGPQNIGKAAKDKSKEAAKPEAKEKKSVGIRNIRGFV